MNVKLMNTIEHIPDTHMCDKTFHENGGQGTYKSPNLKIGQNKALLVRFKLEYWVGHNS